MNYGEPERLLGPEPDWKILITLAPGRPRRIWVSQWPDIVVTAKENIVQGVVVLVGRILTEADDLTAHDRAHLGLLRDSALDHLVRDDS